VNPSERNFESRCGRLIGPGIIQKTRGSGAPRLSRRWRVPFGNTVGGSPSLSTPMASSSSGTCVEPPVGTLE